MRVTKIDRIHGKDEVIGSILIEGSNAKVHQIPNCKIFEGLFYLL